MLKDILSTLEIHIPRSIQVVFNLPNLIESASMRLTADVLLAIHGTNDGDRSIENLDEILVRFELVQTRSNFAATQIGNRLLQDNFGVRIDENLSQNYRRHGLQSTLRRIENLSQNELNEQRINQIALTVARRILFALRHAESFRVHEHSINEIIETVNELCGLMQQRIENAIQQRQCAQTRYEREQANSATANNRAATNTVNNTTTPNNHSKFKWKFWENWQTQTSTPTVSPSTPIAAQPQRNGDEIMLWEACLRLEILQAENRLLSAIREELINELEADKTSLAQLSQSAIEVSSNAERFEVARDWGLKAGEMLLNSKTLTNAVSNIRWHQNELRAIVISHYLNEFGDEDSTLTDALITTHSISQIANIVREEVTKALGDWTIVDALYALSHNEAGTLRCIKDAFCQLFVRDFLATGYQHFLHRQVFAVLTYAPSNHAAANEFFKDWVMEFAESVNIEFDIQADPLTNNRLHFFVENFSVPLSAMSFCEPFVTNTAMQEKAEHPLFTPHPDLLLLNRQHTAAESEANDVSH